jgi:hypothetical protein
MAATNAFDPTLLVRDYGDVESEVAACREHAAVFDFSFMSVARVSGPNPLKVIAQLTDRDLGGLDDGRIRYALCRDSDGWLRSDLTIWKEAADSYLVVSGLGQDTLDLTALVQRDGRAATVEVLDGSFGFFRFRDLARSWPLAIFVMRPGWRRCPISGSPVLMSPGSSVTSAASGTRASAVLKSWCLPWMESNSGGSWRHEPGQPVLPPLTVFA